MSVLSRRRGLGAAATLVNFPVVFAGLIAITTQTNGNDEIALLNLWATWGILQGLVGQVGLISGVLDLKRWNDTTVLMSGLAATAIAGSVSFVLRNRLFPDHETWWIAVVVLAAVVFVVGRQRAELTLIHDAVTALVVAAAENTIRSIAVIAVVFSDAFEWGAIAIVAPFVFSIIVLSLLIPPGRPTESAPDRADFDSISVGLLAGVPALAAYAVIPALTLFDATENLDRIAIAASLLRGPLLIASFLAPWILERLIGDGGRPMSTAGLFFVGFVIIQAGVGLLLPTGTIGELIFHTVLTGLVAGLSYLFILNMARRLPPGVSAVAAIGISFVVFVVVISVSAKNDLVHPFVALSAACAVLPALISRS